MPQHCRIALIPALHEALGDPETADRLRLMAGASERELFAEVVRTFPKSVRLEAEHELRELPPNFMTVLVSSWRAADASGIPFVLDSPPPESVTGAARDRRFAIGLDYDDGAMRMNVMHVAGRHPQWFQVRESAAV